MFHQQNTCCSRDLRVTTLQASDIRASYSLQQCSSRCVVEWLDTGKFTITSRCPTKYLATLFRSSSASRSAFNVHFSLLFDANTTSVESLLSQAQIAQCVGLSLSCLTCERCCSWTCVFQLQRFDQRIHAFGVRSIRESSCAPLHPSVQKDTKTTSCWTNARQPLDISHAPNISSSLSSEQSRPSAKKSSPRHSTNEFSFSLYPTHGTLVRIFH